MRARFAGFTVDLESRQLLREGVSVHLTPKAYQLLILLIEGGARALSKEEIQQALWPSTFVEESNLSVIVAELRSALGDTARQPTYIRTVHGFGYALVPDVVRGSGDAVASRGAWWLHTDNQHIRLNAGENVVGRELPVDVWLDSSSVSRRHARVTVTDSVIVEDLGSKNGTWVDGQRITGPTAASDGADVRFGGVVMTLRWATAAMSTESISLT